MRVWRGDGGQEGEVVELGSLVVYRVGPKYFLELFMFNRYTANVLGGKVLVLFNTTVKPVLRGHLREG